MYKKIGVFLFAILVMACNDKNKPEKPDNLISQDKMVEVLHDLYIVNAAKNTNRKMLEINGISPKAYILKKHKIDSAQFADSNTYYAFEPETYNEILDVVKTRLENEKKIQDALLEKEEKAKIKQRDSLRKAHTNKKPKDLFNLEKK